MNKIHTTEELNAALNSLPEFSRQVYNAIHEGLYAEPGFSDVTVGDVVSSLGCKGRAVNAALGHLYEVGLVFSEDWTANFSKNTFLHTVEHHNSIKR